jgi:hypothetical protein
VVLYKVSVCVIEEARSTGHSVNTVRRYCSTVFSSA